MRLTDKRFWNSCKNAVNEFFFWLFVAFAVLLSIDLWSLLIIAIVSIIGGGVKSFTLLKIVSALGIVLVLFSNFALWQAMYYPKIYNRLISIVVSKKLRLLYFLTLGYVNIYLLNLYYIRFKYSLYELTQYRVNVTYSVLVMFPILNIPVYIAAMRRSSSPLPFGQAAKLYLRGWLATYLMQTDYSSLIQKENEK